MNAPAAVAPLVDALAAQIYDDAREVEDPHWSDLREDQRYRWRRRAQAVVRATAASLSAASLSQDGDALVTATARVMALNRVRADGHEDSPDLWDEAPHIHELWEHDACEAFAALARVLVDGVSPRASTG